MSGASGHTSQNYTNVNFVHYLQKNDENVGLVYRRSQTACSDSPARVWLSLMRHDIYTANNLLYLFSLQTLRHKVIVLRHHSFRANNPLHVKHKLIALINNISFYIYIMTLRM